MKIKYFILTLLFTLIFTIKPINAQYDINVKISETEINKALAALIEARGLNWGKYIGHFLDAWYVNVDAATVDILPNNQVIVNANVAAVMEIDIWLFQFPIVYHPSGSFVGNFEVIGDPNGGFQLKFVLDYDTFSPLGLIIFSLLPYIEINLGTIVLPENIQGLFTTQVPYLQTNNSEVILGFNFAGPRKITLQNDFNGANNVSSIDAYENMQWNEYLSPKNFWWPLNSSHEVRAKNTDIPYANANWKFYWWNQSPSQKNVQKTVLANQDKTESAFFKPVLPLTVQTNLLEGGIGGKILYEGQEQNSPFSDYGFQTPYTTNIGVNNPQLINSRNYYLTSWQDGNTLSNRNISLTGPSTFIANLKGQGLSNSDEGYANNSQRKFLRTSDGVIYSLYESLNRVWLEKSTDNGSSWQIANGGKPIANFNSKNPSMCLTPLGGTYPLSIVLESDGTIFFYEYRIATDQVIYRTDIYTGNYYTETKPVVTYCWHQQYYPQGPVVIWQSLEDDGFGGGLGLHYVALNMDDWNMSQTKHLIPNTDGNSYNPSIAGNDPIHSDYTWKHSPMKFNLVWEQRSSIHSSIRFYQVERLAGNALQFTDYQIISSGNGFTKNYNPSLITVINAQGEFKSRVVWLAERYQAEEEQRTEKGQGTENTEGVQYKTFFKDVGVSGFRSYGNKPNAPTINKLNNNSDYYLAFSEQSNLAGKVVIGSDPTTINQLETIGKDIQMGNGANENQVIALAFHSANLPYYFNRSANMSNVTPKIKSLAIVSGREGVVGKDTAQFYFTVGDVILDDQAIEFVELPDTVLINGKETLNEYLVTNPFTLNDNSVFYYSVQYGITDSASAIQALTDSVFINFTVQLLDANTDAIIGTFDNVTYNSDSVFIYNNIAYQVNVSGLNNRLVKLRLKTETNHQFDYSLTQRYAEESVLGKKFIKQINFNAGVAVTEYALEQNYPNPFNPSTTIRYQLPQDGMVTLKVYDILGSEVATLVNEQKAAGRYEVNFDASRLASGVYIYKLKSGEYLSSKKMMLVK